MSKHDRGAFGELLGRLRKHGEHKVVFLCNLDCDDEDERRWTVSPQGATARFIVAGRTGEEALRRLVEELDDVARKSSGA